MRQGTDTINHISPDYSVDSRKEITAPPDEFNRTPAVNKTRERKRSRSWKAKVMLCLAAAGLVVLGIITPVIRTNPVNTSSVAAANTPAMPVVAQATDAPTAVQTAEPTVIPTPEPTAVPEPGADPILIRSSLVFYGIIRFSEPDRIVSAEMRLIDPNIDTIAAEHTFTREEIDAGIYEAERFDANGFAFEHEEAYALIGKEPELVLETTFTYRTAAGEETVTQTTGAEAVPWVNINFDTEEDVGGIVEMMYGTVYPNCFVVRIEEAETDRLQVVFGDDPSALEKGGVLIAVSVDGATLRGTFEPVELYAAVSGDKTYYFPVYAVPLPEGFPEHGTAHVRIIQRLNDRDYLFEKKTFDIVY